MINIFYDRTGDYEDLQNCSRIPNGIPKEFVEFYFPVFNPDKLREKTNFAPAVYPSDLYRGSLSKNGKICLVDDIENNFIEDGCIGIYPIEIYGAPERALGVDREWNKKFKTAFDYISPKALKYIKNGKLKLYFGLIQEAFYTDEEFKYLQLQLDKYDISDVTVAANDFLVEKRYNEWCQSNHKKVRFKVIVYCHSLFEKSNEVYCIHNDIHNGLYSIGEQYKKHTNSVMKLDDFYKLKSKKRKQKLLCLNRRMRPYRLATLCVLGENNLIKNNSVSFTFKLDPVSFYIEDYFREGKEKRLKKLKVEFDKLRKMKTKIVDYPLSMEGKDGLNHGYGFENHKPYLNTYFSIVTETRFFDPVGFISEKIWKPFAYFHPSILVGSVGSLKYIREFGFKTFHPFIDESYDDCTDGVERFALIEKEIIRLGNMTKDELHKWYWSMEDILIHNYNLFIEYGKNNSIINNSFLHLLESNVNGKDNINESSIFIPSLSKDI
jgi:hypothetical protein